MGVAGDRRPIPRLSLLLAVAFCLTGVGLWAQSIAIDKPAATVRLHTSEVISVRQLEVHLGILAQAAGAPLSPEQKKNALDLLVKEKLIDQAAEQANVSVTPAEINNRLTQQRNQLDRQLGRQLTDAEFSTVIQQQTGLSFTNYREQLAKGLLQQKYVARERPEMLQVPAPAEQAVVDFYEENKTTVFVQPDLVLFKHIFFNTQEASQEQRTQARERAQRVLQEMRNGAEFDTLVVQNSEDESSRFRGGGFGNGYMRRDDRALQQLLGRTFFDRPFQMEVGGTSEVLQSNIGFHIVRVIDKVAARILGLDDKISPDSTQTVRQQINVLLRSNLENQAYLAALNDVLTNLEETAEVRIFEENLSW